MTECSSLPSEPGIYTLVLHIVRPVRVSIGTLGNVALEAGYYLYVGSARGKGGLKARILRHFKKFKRIHWHIDYLTVLDETDIVAIVFSVVKTWVRDLEEELAYKLLEYDRCISIGVKRFGCTDKKSPTHLFRCLCKLRECVEVVTNIYRALNLIPHIIVLDKKLKEL